MYVPPLPRSFTRRLVAEHRRPTSEHENRQQSKHRCGWVGVHKLPVARILMQTIHRGLRMCVCFSVRVRVRCLTFRLQRGFNAGGDVIDAHQLVWVRHLVVRQ